MQCFTCLRLIMFEQPKGKGLCDGVQKDAIRDGCKKHRLAPMDMVRGRTKRRIRYDAQGMVTLE